MKRAKSRSMRSSARTSAATVWVGCTSFSRSGSAFIARTTSGSREKSSFFKRRTWACGAMWLRPFSTASAKSGA